VYCTAYRHVSPWVVGPADSDTAQQLPGHPWINLPYNNVKTTRLILHQTSPTRQTDLISVLDISFVFLLLSPFSFVDANLIQVCGRLSHWQQAGSIKLVRTVHMWTISCYYIIQDFASILANNTRTGKLLKN